MDEGVYLFEKVKPEMDFINEILAFDARKLDALDGTIISKYAVALAQYLIYFKSEVNKAKVNIHIKQRALDSGIEMVLTKDVLKQYKTKANAIEYIISTSNPLGQIKKEIDKIKEELMRIDGVDKTISDLIATLKRELTRRENELYTVRKERYS